MPKQTRHSYLIPTKGPKIKTGLSDGTILSLAIWVMIALCYVVIMGFYYAVTGVIKIVKHLREEGGDD